MDWEVAPVGLSEPAGAKGGGEGAWVGGGGFKCPLEVECPSGGCTMAVAMDDRSWDFNS